MITEDQLEQLAIQWFQDTGWTYVNGTVISPEKEEPEREDEGNIEHRTLNIEHRREENFELPKIGAGIGKGINAAFRGWWRPFRAWNPVGHGTQGWHGMPRWGGRVRWGKTSLGRNVRATGKHLLQVRSERTEDP